MNNLYRIGFQRIWPILGDAKRLLLCVQSHVAAKGTAEIRACQYCKKYGLYDEEEGESLGEFNSRGAYIDHRSARLEKQDWQRSQGGYKDMGSDYSRPQSRNYSHQRNSKKYGLYDEEEEGEFNGRGAYTDHRGARIEKQGWHGSRGDYKEIDNDYSRPGSRNYSHQRNSFPGYRDFSNQKFDGPYSRDRYFNDGVDHPQEDVKKQFKDFPPIQKNFYEEHPDVTARSQEDVDNYRKAHSMILKGTNIPKPITSFNELNVSESVLKAIRDHDFTAPTPIQAQGWPVALSGRDMIGISQTGSGKTLVFALPAVIHIMNQPKPPLSHAVTPQVLVLAPTRELTQQIHQVCTKFRHTCGVNAACAYGGMSKGPQLSRLKNSHICVATPGRLNDFLAEGSISLSHCTYLVLDEADRMLDMGFEPQIRNIIRKIRPDRQTLMWSATWPREVQSLAEDYLKDYVQVTIGHDELTANPNIEQNIHMVSKFEKKRKLKELLDVIKVQEDCKTLVFAQTKKGVDYIAGMLNHECGILAMAIHGDVSQARRDRVLNTFRQQPTGILVATDVAARGLDVNDIHYIINFDMPTNIEDYIHRIGRTARGSKKGVSHSFFTPEDNNLSKDLVEVLQKAGQPVKPELAQLARRRDHSDGERMRRFYSGRRFY